MIVSHTFFQCETNDHDLCQLNLWFLGLLKIDFLMMTLLRLEFDCIIIDTHQNENWWHQYDLHFRSYSKEYENRKIFIRSSHFIHLLYNVNKTQNRLACLSIERWSFRVVVTDLHCQIETSWSSWTWLQQLDPRDFVRDVWTWLSDNSAANPSVWKNIDFLTSSPSYGDKMTNDERMVKINRVQSDRDLLHTKSWTSFGQYWQ